MRVLDKTKSNNLDINMGKRNKKKRKARNKNNTNSNRNDHDDSSDDTAKCTHLNKSLNLNGLRKALKQQGFIGHCSTCTKEASITSKEIEDDLENPTWICLYCGNQGCGRNSKEKHALLHFQTPRSAQHSIACNISTLQIWCYICDDYVLHIIPRLQECLDLVRKFSDSQKTIHDTFNHLKYENSLISTSTIQMNNQLHPKGLSNLGNTCFFNAVLQCLSQTPSLDRLLFEQFKPLISTTLPGSPLLTSESENEEEKKDNNKSFPSDAINVDQIECGQLSSSFINLLIDMQNQKGYVLNPNNLFLNVCKKSPKFKGYQQHDSHELLRHLFDGIKSEESKRMQISINKLNGIGENKKSEQIPLRGPIKPVGRQNHYTIIDSIFGGSFVSTVTCEECQTPSQIFEPFLDVSLPIIDEKLSTSSSACRRKSKRSSRKMSPEEKIETHESENNTDADIEDNNTFTNNSSSLMQENLVEKNICDDSDSNNASYTSDVLKQNDYSLPDDFSQLKLTDSQQNSLKKKFIIMQKIMYPLNNEYQSTPNECSIMSCLSNFTTPEFLTGNNKFNCKNCSKSDASQVTLRNATKRVLIYLPPAILTLHLKRFQQNLNGSIRKVNRCVQFPINLDLAPFCSSLSPNIGSNGRILYNIYGVVEHSGRLNGGHYTAFVKIRPTRSIRQYLNNIEQISPNIISNRQFVETKLNNLTSDDVDSVDCSIGKWYYISDSRVSEVTEETVTKCQAYLLFYERYA